MNLTKIATGMVLLLVAAGAYSQAPQQPSTGASAQGAARAEGNLSADRNGAAASGNTAGAADASAGSSAARLEQGTEISATLTKPVDAGKAKPGDPVEARAARNIRSGDEVVVPRGSRLIGRVTQAQPRGKGSAGSDSTLGIVFDRAILDDRRSIALNGAATALAAARVAPSPGRRRWRIRHR